MEAFAYPAKPHIRRHGPQGYATIDSFRPWLRDEFAFRCVYCLLRERWGLVRGVFHIDHFLPVALQPTKTLIYDNLLYCCASCNAAKSDRLLPNPECVLLADAVQVYPDGTIEGKTRDARRLIRVLGLDDPEYNEFRFIWLGVLALARDRDPGLYRQLMGFPDDLPNLSRLRPPQGNSRPGGVQRTWYAEKQNGALPDTY